jgi:hypothetical protein
MLRRENIFRKKVRSWKASGIQSTQVRRSHENKVVMYSLCYQPETYSEYLRQREYVQDGPLY